MHIKQCMGVCTGKFSKEEYNSIVRQAVDYIRMARQIQLKDSTMK